jgi:signal transduction histidine kinase
MTDQSESPDSLAGASHAPDEADGQSASELRVKLARARSEIELLNAELAETNKGVIALYAELDDRAEDLRQASDLKSRFLSYMSHEFRVPLGAIGSRPHLDLSRMVRDGRSVLGVARHVQTDPDEPRRIAGIR